MFKVRVQLVFWGFSDSAMAVPMKIHEIGLFDCLLYFVPAINTSSFKKNCPEKPDNKLDRLYLSTKMNM